MRQLRQVPHTAGDESRENFAQVREFRRTQFKGGKPMFDPFAQTNPWATGLFGAQPFGYGIQQNPYAAGLGFGTQFQPPFGYQAPQGWAQFASPFVAAGWGNTPQLPPQTWLGAPQNTQPNPFFQQLAAQQIPQIVLEAQRIAQQVPHLAQQIPQLIQHNPQLAQQVPQLQQVPYLLQQAADLCQRVPQLLQAVAMQPPSNGFVGPQYSLGMSGRPFSF